MAFLPFNFTKQKRLKVVIVGGGYAGMAALTNLLHFASDTEITVIDPGTHHIKITHLHETFRYPLSDFLIPFSAIENRYGCKHIQASVQPDKTWLLECQQTKQLTLDDEVLDFDYLIVAAGCRSRTINSDHMNNVLVLNDFTNTSGVDLLMDRLAQISTTEKSISVIGGGPTGIQFLFEIRQFLDRIRNNTSLRLIHSGEHVLEQFPEGFDSYVESRMQDLNIGFFPDSYFQEQLSDRIILRKKHTQEQIELSSSLSILLLGKNQESMITANAFGQVIVDQKILPNIFAAGDCSHYQSVGSNTLTAQSAVRKGKLVARNILRHAGFPGILEPYVHQNLGYVVNLGHADAVGWLGSEKNLITGIPALAVKEIVEAQYDLLLEGIDTYLL